MPVPQLTAMTSWWYAMGSGCHIGKIQKCVAAATLQSHSRLSPKGGKVRQSLSVGRALDAILVHQVGLEGKWYEVSITFIPDTVAISMAAQ